MGKDRWATGNREGNWRGGFGRGGYGRGGPRGGPRGRGFGGNRDGNRYPNNQWHNRPKRDTPGKRLSEEQIGVTEYMSEHEGFNGIIKSRYSDFQVAEINEQGEIAKLTTLAHPELPTEEQVEEDEELLLSKYNVEILPMETWDEINRVALGTATEPVQIDVTTSTKEERTKIHDAVKKAFAESIVGSTVNIDDKKFVRFTKYKKGVRIDNRVKWMWPAEYLYFIVHKENCDTMDAAVRIAERLRTYIKPSSLGYAGTKDRRAKTSQWFSARRLDPRRAAAACRGLRDVLVGDYSFRDQPLKLGMLKGNQFRICLRNVTAADARVAAACGRLRARGFLNYYGLQRFGARHDVPTFRIGRKLLRGNFQEAISDILSERLGPLQEALALYSRAGAVAARAALPHRAPAHAETRLINALAVSPRDFAGALMQVPRNTRLLYLHSYQSLIWNKCLSERVKRFGLVPAVGDLVPLAPDQIKEDTDDEESDDEENKVASETTNAADDKTNESKQTDKKPEKKSKNPDEKQKIPVKTLTQEDIDSNSYTIYDVIMPLPGYLIEYPPNMRDYYETLLTEDGLTLELRHKNRSYSMSGAYRRAALRPAGLRWRCARYSEPHADLLLSDRDLMRGETRTAETHDGEYKALLLTMSLPASCYATMALRELMKVDTSCDNQAAQNNYHKRKLNDGTQENSDHGKRAKEGEDGTVTNSEAGKVTDNETGTVTDNETGKVTDSEAGTVTDSEAGKITNYEAISVDVKVEENSEGE